MNYFLFYKASTIEINEFLFENNSFWHFSCDYAPYNYSLELEEFFNDDKTLFDTFNITCEEEKLKNKKICIDRLTEQIKRFNVITKVINLENYLPFKNKFYVVREINSYIDSLIQSYNYDKFFKKNWKYNKILNFCKQKYDTDSVKDSFYYCAIDEYKKINKKCEKENIELITLAKNEKLFHFKYSTK